MNIKVAKSYGFSLLELLIVTAIISVLLVGSLGYYQNFRIHSLVNEAAQKVASDLEKERFESERFNEERTLSIDSNTPEQYLANGVTQYLPNGIALTKAGRSKSVTFYPPYGTTSASERSFLVSWKNQPERYYKYIRVVGVTGKVIIQDE